MVLSAADPPGGDGMQVLYSGSDSFDSGAALPATSHRQTATSTSHNMNRPTPNSDELPSTVRPRTLDIEASEMSQGNRLLAALAVGERLRLGSELRLVELGMREQIYDIVR
jgi:hypothetical protein